MPEAGARALAVAAAWRAGGVDATALLGNPAPAAAPLPALPASTTFATLDRDGNAVVCARHHGQPVRHGADRTRHRRRAGGGAGQRSPPLLAAAIAWNGNERAFRAAVGGTGQQGAPLAAAVALQNTLHSTEAMPVPVPEPGRADVIACGGYLPGRRILLPLGR